MQAAGIHAIELVFLVVLVFVAALAALAKRLQTPYPIILAIGGLALSMILFGSAMAGFSASAFSRRVLYSP